MIKLAAHLESNLRNLPFAERWQIAQRAGFTACEFVWRNYDVAEAADLQSSTGLTVCSLGGTTGFKAGTGRPLLLQSDEHDYLLAEVEKAIAYAQKLNCRQLVFVVGDAIAGWSTEQHRDAAVAGLRSVAPLLERAGITAVIEPLNTKVNHKGHYLNSTTEAIAIVQAVDSPQVKVLYDIYHMQIMEGNLIGTIRQYHDYIGYYHVAGVPGRQEPIGGEVNFPAVFAAIAETGYDGYIGLEYSPAMDPEKSLRLMKSTYAYLG